MIKVAAMIKWCTLGLILGFAVIDALAAPEPEKVATDSQSATEPKADTPAPDKEQPDKEQPEEKVLKPTGDIKDRKLGEFYLFAHLI